MTEHFKPCEQIENAVQKTVEGVYVVRTCTEAETCRNAECLYKRLVCV